MLIQRDKDRANYWSNHYADVAEAASEAGFASDWVNTSQQYESMWAALKFAGPIAGQDTLDAACGTGELVAILKMLGARRACGFEFVAELVEEAERRHGGCEFGFGDLTEPDEWSFAGEQFDLVTCVESLHPVPTADALRALWHLVRPGGRLVAVFTNTDGPINDLANWRHGGVHYFGLGEAALNPTLRSLGGVATWRIGGLHLADDQRLEIYDSRRTYDTEPAPYSWVLAARKAG